MKIRTFTKSIFLCLLVLGVTLKTHGTSFSEGRGSHKICGYENFNNFYVDPDVVNFPSFSSGNGTVFQLISHGKPGQLWLDNRWRNAVEIGWFIQSNHLLPSGSIHMNIYGCSFGKGREGKNAIEYLQRTLSVSISASDNVTGQDGDWILEVGYKVEALSFPQFLGNLQYAAIDDMDGDGVPNFVDVDDDNDGVLDAIESPKCYIQSTDVAFPANVTSMVPSNANNPIGYSFDRNASTNSSFQNSGIPIAGITLYEITPATPIALSSLLFGMTGWSMTQNATSTVMLQGFNGTSWDTLSTIAARNNLPLNNAPDTFKNTLHLTTVYQKFRIQGVAGTNNFSGVTEISIRPYNYSASSNPRPNCVVDNDNDGISNNFDLDSDGDGCPDAFESGTYNKSGITAASGDLQNGSNGTVSSTVNSPNAIVSGPFGGNGFADGLQLAADSNAYLYAYTYRQYALFATRVLCASTDGDGLNDMADVDDDNDGILDMDETVSCYSPTDSLVFTVYKYALGAVATEFILPPEYRIPSDVTWASADLSGYSPSVKATYTTSGANLFSFNFPSANANNFVTQYAANEQYFNGSSANNEPSYNVTVFKTQLKQSASFSSVALPFNLNSSDEDVVFLLNGVPFGGPVGSNYGSSSAAQSGSGTVVFNQGDVLEFRLRNLVPVQMGGVGLIGGVGNFLSQYRCDLDSDNDGIPNRLDLDSDGDGCPDIKEAGVSAQPGVTTTTGIMQNGSNGSVTSSTPTTGALLNVAFDTNGFATVLESPASPNIYKYNYYYPWAISKIVNACADFDGDGISDITDIDDDSDGILDAIEAPSCYYLAGEALIPFNVISSLVELPANPMTNTFDNNNATYGRFNNNNLNIAGVTLYEITPTLPLKINSVNFAMTSYPMTNNASSTAMLQGYSGGVWDTLSTIASHSTLPLAGLADTFKNTLYPNKEYTRFRIQGVAGTNNYSGVTEITISTRNHVPSAQPKAVCLEDTDNDGINNNFDLDSDGDGCPDAKESGDYIKPGVTALPGSVKNGYNGQVASTITLPDALIDGSVGGNGFADVLQSVVDTNNYNYTYIRYFLFSFLSVCADYDGDGIGDLVDIDDDNDGIIDEAEAPSCFFTKKEALDIVAVKSDLTFSSVKENSIDSNYTTTATLNGGQTITNKVIYQFQFATQVKLSQLTDSLNSTTGIVTTGSTYRVEGATDEIGPWIDVSGPLAAPATPGAGNHIVWPLTTSQFYTYYRIFGLSGTTASGNSREFIGTVAAFSPSLNPKNTCNADPDNDGRPNCGDLDSDGDGCPDARETNTYNKPGITSQPGNIQNGSNGIVTLTVAASDAVISGPYGNNGFSDTLQSVADTNLNRYNYDLYSQYALSKALSICADTDNDGISDILDIDDDNDGILDAIEAPDCYFTKSEAAYPRTVTSSIPTTNNTSNDITKSYDKNIATYSYFASAAPITGITLFEIIPVVPGIITSINFNLINWPITNSATSTVMLQGFNGAVWDTLSPISAHNTLPATGTADTFKNTLRPNVSYDKYRIQGVSGNANLSGVTEITISTPLLYSSSQHPKFLCLADNDNDGLTNDKDLDSDGDGCADARETNTYNQSGVTVLSGGLRNGSGGQVTDTVNAANAIIAGPYGNNGFANILQLPTDTNAYKYLYNFYSSYSLSNFINVCSDWDNDGVFDLVDIDDDNDGILDNIESTDCYYSKDEIVSPLSITTNLVTTSNIANSIDRDNTTISALAPNAAIAGVTLYEMTPVNQMVITSINFLMGSNYMTSNATSTVMLQGLGQNGWDTLGAIEAHNSLPPANQADTFKNTLHAGVVYSKYRIQGVSGTNYISSVKEITLSTPVVIPSLYPKSICLADGDDDGLPNDKDLDSDGDGCPDAKEGGTFNQANVTANAGDVKNGSGGTITSTINTPNAIIAGPYNNNGFADVLQSPLDSNVYKYNYTFQYADDKELNYCLDSDHDGVPDFLDLDDDNDGVLDLVECPGLNNNKLYMYRETFDNQASVSRWNNAGQVTSPKYYTEDDITVNSTWTGATIYSPQGGGFITSHDVGGGRGSIATSPLPTAATDPGVFNASGATVFSVDLFDTDPGGYAVDLPYSIIIYAFPQNITLTGNYSPAQIAKFGGVPSANPPVTVWPKAPGWATLSLDVSAYNLSKVAGFSIAVEGITNGVQEVMAMDNVSLYRPVQLSDICDLDHDGIPNTLDLDTDGDGCPDSKEGNVGGTLLSGNVVNGNGTNNTTTVTPSSIAVGPYDSNGVAVGIQTIAGNAIINYNVTYNPTAVSKNLDACKDTDGDNISDFIDLDDDNDGVLDAVESPSCYYSKAEASDIISIISDLRFASIKENAIDSNFNTLTSLNGSQDITNKTVIQIQFNAPIQLTKITDSLYNATGILAAGATYRIEGSRSPAGPWIAVSGIITTTSTSGQGNHVVLPITSSEEYSYYRMYGLSGITASGSQSREIFASGVTNYVSSANPKPSICTDDADNDGITNDKDLDSDGDGCTDAREAGTYNQAGVSTLSGTVQNGTSGFVTSSITKGIAVISGPYGNNGFANTLQSPSDTNAYNYVYTYSNAISAAIHSNCGAMSDTVVYTPACPTCPVTVCKGNEDVDSTGATYSTCGTPAGYTATTVNGCTTFTPNGSVTDTARTCVVICKNGLCDTSYVILTPPITPDTAIITPACRTCPRTVCVVADDLVVDSTTTYSSCGLTPQQSSKGSYTIDAHGCMAWRGNATITVNDTIHTCIVACSHGKCDTTYVTINPPTPPYGNDTLFVQSPGPGVPTPITCPTADDVPPDYTNITYRSCGLSQADTSKGVLIINANGCGEWTPNSTQHDTITTCVAKCADTVIAGNTVTACDTTVIYLVPPPVADTVHLTPACPTCTVTTCTTNPVVNSGTVFHTCGAPNGYTISGPTVAGCFTFTPTAPSLTDTVKTCIVACNGNICDTTYVFINPPTTPDTVIVTPACPTCPVSACPIVAGIDTVGATYSTCGTPPGYTSVPGVNGCTTYTPNGTVTTESNTCIVICKNGHCDTTYVKIKPPITADTINVTLNCATCATTVCPVLDDVDTAGGGATYNGCAAPVGYTVTTAPTGCRTYTPTGPVTDTSETCIVICNNGKCDTTHVVLYPPTGTTPDTVITKAPCPTCPITVCPVVNEVDPQGATYTNCGIPPGYTSTLDTNGCLKLTPVSTGHDTTSTCIIMCNNGKCDTTRIILYPPVSPDTLLKQPNCPTCPVLVCPVVNDVNPTGATYSTCGQPTGASSTAQGSYSVDDNGNGCYSYTPSVPMTDTFRTCIVTCNNGVCDTTHIVLLPPGIYDTVKVTPACPTCPVTACVLPGNVDTVGAQYSSCVPTPGYTTTALNGCVTYTPTGPITDTVRTCITICNNGTCDVTSVVIYPPIKPDTVSGRSQCPTCPVTICPVVNDVNPVGATYTSCGTPINYSSTVGANGCITYMPGGVVLDTAKTCIVMCNNNKCDTTYVTLYPPKPGTPDSVTIKPPCAACPIVGCVVGDDVDTAGGGAVYSSCGPPAGYSLSTLLGCNTYTPNMPIHDTAHTCIVVCKGGVCDTTYVTLLPPTPVTPDTVTLTPPCAGCHVTACVVGDDVDTTGGVATYSTCGNPAGYSTTMVNGCVTYTPTGPVTDTIRTCITVCVGNVCDTTYVTLNPPPPVTPDSVKIAAPCPTCPVTTCAVADDVDTTGGGITYSTCGTPAGYTATTVNGCTTYTPTGAVTDTSHACIVACKNGICDTTYITLNPPATSDSVKVTAPCPTCPVTACVVGDDVDTTGGGATYIACGTPPGYTASTINGCTTFTPNGTVTDTTHSCIMVCKGGICDTTYITLNPPTTSDTVKIKAPCATCPVMACVVGDNVDTAGGGVTYSTCGAPAGYTVSTVNGCTTYTPNGSVTDTGRSCIVICKGTICDTTYVILYPPATPDSITITPTCATCPITACVIGDDVDTAGGGVTYHTCGVPAGYTATVNNGCTTYTPSGSVTDTAHTCIVICKGNICDTTYITLNPPASNKPDSVTVTPPCTTCPVTACVVANGIDTTGGGVTYSSCGLPPGYTATTINGCTTYRPNGSVTDTGHTCIVACKGTVCDTTYVTLNPPPPITTDTLLIASSCDTCSVTGCAVVDDVDTTGGGIVYTSCETPVGYTAITVNGCTTFKPIGTVTDTVSTCIVACKNSVCDTTFLMLFPPSTPLQIKVVSFEGRSLQNNTNQLSWSVTNEDGMKHYSILRSTDQQSWINLGSIAAKGSGSVQQYQLIDNNPEEKAFYRLSLQPEKGNPVLYPKVVYLQHLLPVGDRVSVYPNPARSIVTLEYNSIGKNARVHIRMTDITGRTVKAFDKTFHSGKNVMEMNLDGLVDGAYLIHYNNAENGNSGTLKFIKNKE